MKRVAFAYAAAALVLVLGAVALLRGSDTADVRDGARFNSELWRTGTGMERIAMLSDLVSSGVLLNKSRAQLEGMLGPPFAEDLPGGKLTWKALRGEVIYRRNSTDPIGDDLTVYIEPGGVAYEVR